MKTKYRFLCEQCPAHPLGIVTTKLPPPLIQHPTSHSKSMARCESIFFSSAPMNLPFIQECVCETAKFGCSGDLLFAFCVFLLFEYDIVPYNNIYALRILYYIFIYTDSINANQSTFKHYEKLYCCVYIWCCSMAIAQLNSLLFLQPKFMWLGKVFCSLLSAKNIKRIRERKKSSHLRGHLLFHSSVYFSLRIRDDTKQQLND